MHGVVPPQVQDPAFPLLNLRYILNIVFYRKMHLFYILFKGKRSGLISESIWESENENTHLL